MKVKTKYIKIISVVFVVVLLGALLIIPASARVVEGGADGAGYSGAVYETNTILLNSSDFILMINGEGKGVQVVERQNPLFNESSVQYLTSYTFNPYVGTSNSNALFTLTRNLYGDNIQVPAGYDCIFKLSYATNMKMHRAPALNPSAAPALLVYYKESSDSSVTKYVEIPYVSTDLASVNMTNEGVFEGSIRSDDKIVITQFMIRYYTDTTVSDWSSRTGFYIGNIIADTVVDDSPLLPNYKNPNTNSLGGAVDKEQDADDVLNDTVGGINEMYGDINNFIISDGLMGEFTLVRSILDSLLGIRIFYRLVMVSVAFGLMVFLINLGSTVAKSFRKKGD